jgi:serine protease inhibitor
MPGPLIFFFSFLFSKNTEDIKLSTFQAMVSDKNRPARPEYEDVLENIYKADLLSVDFSQPKDAYNAINQYASEKTNGELQKVVKPNDVLTVSFIDYFSIII